LALALAAPVSVASAQNAAAGDLSKLLDGRFAGYLSGVASNNLVPNEVQQDIFVIEFDGDGGVDGGTWTQNRVGSLRLFEVTGGSYLIHSGGTGTLQVVVVGVSDGFDGESETIIDFELVIVDRDRFYLLRTVVTDDPIFLPPTLDTKHPQLGVAERQSLQLDARSSLDGDTLPVPNERAP